MRASKEPETLLFELSLLKDHLPSVLIDCSLLLKANVRKGARAPDVPPVSHQLREGGCRRGTLLSEAYSCLLSSLDDTL